MNKKGMALSQVFSLVLAIVALAFFAGLSMPEVSAASQTDCSKEGGICGDTTVFNCVSKSDLSVHLSFESGKCDGDNNNLCCPGFLKEIKDNELSDDEIKDIEMQQKADESADEYVEVTETPAISTVASKEDGSTPISTYIAPVTAVVGIGSMLDKGVETVSKVKDFLGITDKSVSTLKTTLDTSKGLKSAYDGLSLTETSSGFVDTTSGLQSAQNAVSGVENSGSILDGVDTAQGFKDASRVTTTAAKGAKTGFFSGGKGASVANGGSTAGGYALHTAGMAVLGAAIVIAAFKIAGASDDNMKKIKTGAYVSAAATTATLVAIKMAGGLAAGGPPGLVIAGIVAVAAGLYAAVVYQDYSQEIFTYKLNIWQPESKGEHCTECNDLRYGCSEYQCKTFGADCGILNAGTTDEVCDWQNPNDIKPPVMTQLDILDTGYSYDPNEDIALPDRGIDLVYNDGCIPAFTNVKFGVKTDEPAICKIDLERKSTYDEMISFMAEGPIYTYNHTLEIPSSAFPSNYSLTEAGWTANTGQDHDFYIRCTDANDNISPYHVVMSFCVDQGPDTTAPTISTNYLNDAYVTYNQSTIEDLEVYTNEPADCRWDYDDVAYEDMDQAMKQCSTTVGDYTFSESYSYGCVTSLSGLENGEINKFYIRCEDKPLLEEGSQERRISNEESYELRLIGTNPLVIDSIVVNDEEMYSTDEDIDEDFIFQDATDTISVNMVVETSQGADELGGARCRYTPFGSKLKYEFYNNGNFEYTSENFNTFNLLEDAYIYDIQCCDLANNCDTASVDFIVDTDLTSPEIVRAYYEENNMKITTNEDADCVYMLDTCNYLFKNGIAFSTKDNIDHFTDWDTSEDLYVKCKDIFGNVPADTCSIIVRATDKYSGENTVAKDILDVDF